MNEYRVDKISRREVISAAHRSQRPRAIQALPWPPEEGPCPFCRGNESATPPAIHVSPANGPWQVRVVPNLYPAVTLDPAEPSQIHQVIIESAEHLTRQTALADSHHQMVFETYRDQLHRFRTLDSIQYVQIFKNCGPAAGATLEHSHSQIIALDRVPAFAQAELLSCHEHWIANQQCAFCQLIEQEQNDAERIVLRNEKFVAICPFASRLPYEIWILPVKHAADFDAVPNADLAAFAQMVKKVLARLEQLIPNVAYNYHIHSAPFDSDCYDHYHWHMELIPRVAGLAGFELATGLFVNPVLPEQAAQQLRSV